MGTVTQTKASYTARLLVTVVMLMNTAIAGGGVLFGWSSVVTMLDNEGQFPNMTKKDRVAKYNLIFTLGANMLSIASVVFGITLDMYGPLLNSLAGAAICGGGYVLLAFSSDSFDAFIPAILMISFGGIGVYLPHFPFGNLYPKHGSTIISAVSGAFTASGLNWFVLQLLASKYDISRKTIFLGYAFAVGGVFVLILIFYPLHTYNVGDRAMIGFRTWFGGQLRGRTALQDLLLDQHLIDDSEYFNSQPLDTIRPPKRGDGDGSADALAADADRLYKSDSHLVLGADGGGGDLSGPGPDESEAQTVWQVLTSPACIWMGLYFSTFLLLIAYYTASIADQLTSKNADKQPSYLIAFLLIFNLLPLPLSAGVGWVISNMGYAFSTCVSTSLAFLGMCVMLIPSIETTVLAFILLAGTRALLFAIMFSYVAEKFPGRFYGKVVGIITFAAAVIGTIQIGLSRLSIYTFDNNYMPANIFFIVMCLPFLYYSFWLRRRAE